MSIASKRRYVTHQYESEMYLPVDGDVIALVQAARGNNLHEVLDQFGDTYLVSMPGKFRKAVWIRKGQFVVIRPIEEGDKVRAEIEHVLDCENVLYIREYQKWPAIFEDEAKKMTREGKREGKGEGNEMIDKDMLPPSCDEDEDSGEEDADDEEEEEADEGEDEGEEEEGEEEGDDSPIISQYNPNRLAS